MNWNSNFSYDPATGELTWIAVRHGVAHVSGRIAGSLHRNGYRRVHIQGKELLVHRIIWEMHNGPIPKGLMIDHVDGDKTNNRIENLRLASPVENQQNRIVPRSNTTGFRGVTWHKSTRRFQARCRHNGRNVFLGAFRNAEDASNAYQEYARKAHGEFYRA